MKPRWTARARLRRSVLVLAGAALAVLGRPSAGEAQWLLVPMDRAQQNHLRAYGLTYWSLEQQERGEWLLNFRGGSFLLPDRPSIRREAALRGVSIEPMGAAAEARMRATIAGANMEAVPLERAPKVAIYTPPNSTPWDDAVTMALEYAGIPYETIWDYEVLEGDLSDYEWIHLHHEDFTGQYSKFFITYCGGSLAGGRGQPETRRSRASGGFANVPELKKAREPARIRDYVEAAEASSSPCARPPETLELALAAQNVSISQRRTRMARHSDPGRLGSNGPVGSGHGVRRRRSAGGSRPSTRSRTLTGTR